MSILTIGGTMPAIAFALIIIGVCLLFYVNVLKEKLSLKKKFLNSWSYGYILIIVGFFVLLLTTNGYSSGIEVDVPNLIQSLAKFFWPTCLLIGMLMFKQPIENLITLLIERVQAEYDPEKKIWKFSLKQFDENKKVYTADSEIVKSASYADMHLSGFESTSPKLVNDLVNNIKSKLQTEKINDTRENVLLYSLAWTIIRENFFQAYNSIFGTQIHALQFLESNGTSKLDSFFEAHKILVASSKISIEPKFSGWLYFLKHYLFVEDDQDNVTITPIGKEFLKFIEHKGLNLAKNL